MSRGGRQSRKSEEFFGYATNIGEILRLASGSGSLSLFPPPASSPPLP